MNEYNPAALIPDYQSLMLPVLRAFEKDVVRIGVVIKKLSDDLDLGEAASILLPSGRQTVFANRVHWAKTYLAKAGLVGAPQRDHFRLTARGAEVLKAVPERIDNCFLSQFEEFRTFRTIQPVAEVATPVDAEPNQATPDEIMRAAHRRIEAELAEELLIGRCCRSSTRPQRGWRC